MFLLLSFPNELIDAVISNLTDRPTLLALAQACQKLQPLAEAQLPRYICIRDGPSISRLTRVLEQPPWRVRAVEYLEVTPSMHSWKGVETMPVLVGRLGRLRSLKVEAPMINRARKPEWWADGVMDGFMDLFAGNGALGSLTSFTLHSHGTNSRFYNIKKVLPVFLSPTLRHLHLSCVDISCATETFTAFGSESPRTPLETLILQRCRVESSALGEFQAILSRPRALRSFTVLLDVDFRQLGMQLDQQRAHAPNFLAAIQQHSESLEYLRYMHRPINMPARGSPEHFNSSLSSALSTLRQYSPGLSTFTRLHTLFVDYRSNFAELLLDKALAPPNLHTLGLTGLRYDYEQSWRHLPAYVTAIASATPFPHLRLHTKPDGLDIADVSKIFSRPVATNSDTPPHRDALHTLANALEKRSSIKLVCAHQRRHLAGLHPPFLYGEEMPHEAVIFDSEKLWVEDGGVDGRFEVQVYATEEGERRWRWRGPFSGLGNSFWTE
ncbi:hypothetical protein N0V90_007845 [Kalmusia sp. IMI 367209]|nr:hypothetical protein N0V90_007845 [Kalmusia sp. IMI 367209]